MVHTKCSSSDNSSSSSSSSSGGSNIHRIPVLSGSFIAMNDDFFLTAPWSLRDCVHEDASEVSRYESNHIAYIAARAALAAAQCILQHQQHFKTSYGRRAALCRPSAVYLQWLCCYVLCQSSPRQWAAAAAAFKVLAGRVQPIHGLFLCAVLLLQVMFHDMPVPTCRPGIVNCRDAQSLYEQALQHVDRLFVKFSAAQRYAPRHRCACAACCVKMSICWCANCATACRHHVCSIRLR
jgi:hypothetical protein